MLLHQDVQHVALLVHCPPQIVFLSIDSDDYSILDATCLLVDNGGDESHWHSAVQTSYTRLESLHG